MFHFYIKRKLEERWKESFSVSPVNFLTLFGGYADEPSWIAAITKVYNKLTADEDYGLKFQLGYTINTPTFPAISVSMREEPSEMQFLGYGTDYSDSTGGQEYAMLVKQTATIHVIADNDITAIALNELVRQTMMTSLSYFESLGFIGTLFTGSEDLLPGEEYMPEQSGIMTRKQTWTTLYEPKVVIPGSGNPSDIFVHAQDVTIDNISGGVAGEAE